MSRLTIDFTVANAGSGSRMSAIPGALVTVFYRNSDGTEGGVAPVYEFGDPTVLTTLSQPLGSDSQGRIPGWLDPGDYIISVTASGYTSYSTAYTVPSTSALLLIQDPSGTTMPSEPIIQFAGSSVTVVDDPTNTRTVITPGGSPGAPTVRMFPFAFDTPGLLTGADVYTPTVGDILLDAWVEIDTAWNGTTPQCDVGSFSAAATAAQVGPPTFGWWGWTEGTIDLTLADKPQGTEIIRNRGFADPLLLSTSALMSSGSTGLLQILYADFNWATRVIPAKFATSDPIKVAVTANGRLPGTDPGSTQGAAVLYLITATPV